MRLSGVNAYYASGCTLRPRAGAGFASLANPATRVSGRGVVSLGYRRNATGIFLPVMSKRAVRFV